MKRTLLTAIVICANVLPCNADLIGWWNFEEGTGITTDEKTGRVNNGTLGEGATWDTTEFAPVSGSTASIFFDGSDTAHVIVEEFKADEIGETNARSIALWMRSAPGVTPEASNLGFIGYGQNQAGDKFNFRTQNNNGPIDGNIRVEVNGGYIIGTTVVIDGEWHHVAMTWEDDGSPDVEDVLLYVDGQLEEISASLDEVIHTDTVNGIDFAISDDHSNREWHGWLDDLRVYDEVLDANAIQKLATGSLVTIINTFSANVEVVAAGETVTLSWDVETFDALTIDGDTGDVAPMTTDGTGRIQIMPSETTTYVLTGTLNGESQSKSVSVVVGKPIIDLFTLSGSETITEGGQTTLTWQTRGADSLSISPLPGNVTGLDETVVAPSDSTVFTLTATNASGSTTAELMVTVVEAALREMVAHFDFEEGAGPTTMDASKYGRTGTLGNGSEWTTTEFAPVGSSASIFFDGSDDANIIVDDWTASEIGATSARSIALWIRSAPDITPEDSNLGFIGYGQNQAGDKFNFRTQNNNGPIDGNIRVEVNGGYIIGTTVVIDGEWHHVAMTWEDDGSPDVEDVMLYVDGQLEEISASLDEVMHTDTENGINFAISDDHGNREWNGWLDDIRVYNYALTNEEVEELTTTQQSPFRIIKFDYDQAAGSVTITWNSREDASYSIDCSANLTGTWSEVEDGWPSEGSQTSFSVEEIAPDARSMFFRIREE